MNPLSRALRRLRCDELPDHCIRDRGDQGFGMIDCIIAMVVLLAVLIPTSYLFTNVLSNAASARQRLTALSVAEQWIENLNTQGPPEDANSQPEVGTALTEPSSILSGITYKVSALFKWTDASGGTPDFCDTNTSPVLGLQVTVSWASNQSITDQAILNFPATGNLTDGYLAIQVNGDPVYPGTPPTDVSNETWAQRVQTVPVQVSGSNLTTPYSLTPGSNGCTFLELTPGTYTVQVGPGGSGSAYVASYNEASSETQPSNQSAITVTDAEITEVAFQYDEGAYVGLSYPTTTAIDDGITCPTTATIVTCLVMGQTPTSTASPNASPAASGIVKTGSGWAVAAFPSTMTRVEDADCSSSACIAVGYSSSGGAAAVSTNGTTWTSSTLPAGVSQLTEIDCPKSATTPACIAIGESTTSTGVLLTATISGSTATWTKDTIPSTTALTNLVCPSSTAQPLCFVTGTTSSGSTIFSNTGSSSPGTTWMAFTQSGMTMSTIVQITCNSTTFCVAVGTGTVSSSLVPVAITITSVSGTTVTWKPFTYSGFTMSTFTSVACTTSGNFCWASGTGKIGSGSVGPIVIYCNTTTGSKCASGSSASAWLNDTVPSGLSLITGLTCPSTAVPCFALDTTSSSAGVIELASGTAWASQTLPSGIVTLSALDCPTTTACYAVGTSSTAAIVDVLKAGTWSSATFSGTTGGNPVYISGLHCTAATTCEMAAATESAGEVFDYANATVSFSASSTPSTLAGMYLDNPPIMVSNSNLSPNTTIEMSAPTTANGPQVEVGPLFPFESGYSIAVGYCASELTTASVSASTTPGASLTSSPMAPTVVLPMGLLPIEAVNSSGVALSGATISIVDASCSSSAELTPLSSGSFPALTNPPANPSNPTSYSMPTTGVDGLSRIDVIYGTYSVTVKSGVTSATTTVTVNPTSIVVGATTYYMPNFVPVAD